MNPSETLPQTFGVEENRVADAVAVFAEAANGDVDVDARALVDDAERNRRRRTVFVADELFGIEVVDALVLRGSPPKVKRLPMFLKVARMLWPREPEKMEGSDEES